jgi:hypothetical protein
VVERSGTATSECRIKLETLLNLFNTDLGINDNYYFKWSSYGVNFHGRFKLFDKKLNKLFVDYVSDKGEGTFVIDKNSNIADIGIVIASVKMQLNVN